MHTMFDSYKFNWTMSYRLDAEISECSYGCSYKLQIDDEAKKKEEELLVQTLELEYYKRKISALWFVSNCGASFRNQFALSLRQYISVRIYGNCREQFMLDFENRTTYRLYLFIQIVIDFFMIPIDIIRYLLAFLLPLRSVVFFFFYFLFCFICIL